MKESFFINEKIHLSKIYFKRVEKRCELFEKENFKSLKGDEIARMSYLCALIRAELLNNNLAIFKIHKRFLLNHKIAAQSFIDDSERKYLEARILLELPPQFGKNLGKALLLLESLKRIKPELSSTNYFVAYSYLLLGNINKAIYELKDNLVRFPNDSRSEFALKKIEKYKLNELIDKKDYGWALGLHHSSSWAWGLFFKIFDDALMDKNRALSISGKLGSKPRVEVDVSLVDNELLNSHEIGLSLYFEHGKKDFYSDSGMRLINIDKRRFEVFASMNIYKALYFFLGWDGTHLAIYDDQSSFYSGAFFKFSLLNVDSVFDPIIGEKIEVKGYFPSGGLLSDRTFEKWSFDLWKGFFLGKQKSLFFNFFAEYSSGDIPFEEYSCLGRLIMSEEYRNKKIFGSKFGYRMRLFGPFNLGAFVMLGSAFSDDTPLLRYGGGARFIFNTSNLRRKTFEFQSGIFDNHPFFFTSLGAFF